MNQKNLDLCKGLVKSSYIDQATQATSQYNKLVESLLTQRRLPDQGWSDKVIELFLEQVSMMDSNNFVENIGVGEREGRVFSGLVQKRHYGLSHGIGRSGDINEQQPKAAGSSLIQKLTNYLVLDAMKIAGFESDTIPSCLVLPMATGMTLALTMATLAQQKPQAKYVLWPRIDQKSCLKSIATAGLVPVPIENIVVGDLIKTNMDAIQEKISQLGRENILCIFSTTSCFAPRAPDDIVSISKLCKQENIAHIINNAYGIQDSKIVHNINQSCRQGRVDAFIQSTDKNFMVPVGGAIVASPNKDFIQAIGKNYPGRANGSPILDLFITLLSMGKDIWKTLLDSRKSLLPYFTESLTTLAKEFNERLLDTVSENKISFGITLSNLKTSTPPSLIGSKLFSRSCSGSRVIDLSSNKKNTVANIEFNNYGSHTDHYPPGSYLTIACAIGIEKQEIDIFIQRLRLVLKKELS
ncbi:hypothetical protein CYY_007680 [Polysphondylium violaceum]|uniref:O-phosphoseryl-tRNA(Sec) selenium transferase n=1 Tax=Polysphondylium violaceum TaxID=133409 RepID=A0A8J4PPA9_9MYCE|nr:hypothetical protein CYY_007680 [Polysphondylium violaceum]